MKPPAETETLRRRLARDHRLPLEEALRVARDLAQAIDRAGAAGARAPVVPERIVLTEQGARLAGADETPAVAGVDLVPFTPAMAVPYTGPERAGGRAGSAARADQYALACVVYEMLAGEPPFAGPNAEAVAYQHQVAAPRPVTERRPGVPPDVAGAIARALSKAPGERFPSATAFVDEMIDSARGSEMLDPRRRIGTLLLVAIPFLVMVLAFAAGWVGRGCRQG